MAVELSKGTDFAAYKLNAKNQVDIHANDIRTGVFNGIAGSEATWNDLVLEYTLYKQDSSISTSLIPTLVDHANEYYGGSLSTAVFALDITIPTVRGALLTVEQRRATAKSNIDNMNNNVELIDAYLLTVPNYLSNGT